MSFGLRQSFGRLCKQRMSLMEIEERDERFKGLEADFVAMPDVMWVDFKPMFTEAMQEHLEMCRRHNELIARMFHYTRT